MLKEAKRLAATACIAGALSPWLEGCSGSSSDASAPPGIAHLSGIVFAESKCANVRVDIIAANGAMLAQAQTDANGNYAASFINAPSNPARFVSASCPNADGSEAALVSPIPADMAIDANAAQTVNLNEPATLLSALLTHSGDPSKLGDELKSGALTIDAQGQATASSRLFAMLQQLVKATGLAILDPVTTPMADEARIAQLLQSVSIRFLPQDDGSRTVRIRLKLASRSEADGQAVFQARAADLADAGRLQTLIATVSGVGVGAADLAPAGTGARIDDLVARMNRCAATYTLPYGDFNRTAACSAIFVNGDRNAYLNDGLRYDNAIDEKTLDIAAIDSTGQALSYSSPSFEYLRPNGILGFAVLRQSPDGTKMMSLDARIGTDGKLGLSGNQYPFNMSVVPHAERRSFLHQPASNYLSTGYRFNIPLQYKGSSAIAKVVVTPPASLLPNISFTLLPGANDMVLAAPNGSGSGSAFVRLRSQYADASSIQRHPSLRDTSQYFIQSDLADAAVAAIAPHAQVWKAEFYHDGSSVPETPQYYRVPARPPTIAELSRTTLPDLSAASRDMIADMLSQDAQGVDTTLLSGMPALTLTATGSLPLYLSVHGVTTTEGSGGTSALAFRDALSFLTYVTRDLDSPLSNPRFAPRPTSPNLATTVPCANGLNGDRHCSSKDNYLAPSDGTVVMTGIELKAYPAEPVEKAHFLSVMQLGP